MPQRAQPTARLLRSLAASLGLIAMALPASAQLVIFETSGITLGDDPVECTDQGTYRHCVSDLGSERILSHDGLPLAERIPLDFQLYLPPAPFIGPDGNYPLVVFLHGWGNNKSSIGGGMEGEFISYAEGHFAVLSYSARAWGSSCGATQQLNPECQDQWNHLADSRFEVRDTQYIAGLLADELSDTGTPLIDPQRIGVTGVSYGGGQTTQLAGLRNRVVNTDDTLSPWTSPSGKAMQIAAAAPIWPWTDLAYSLLPNGRQYDYVSNNSYRGPSSAAPIGVNKSSYVAGLYALGQTGSAYAPSGSDPDINTWFSLINAGEPYEEATLGDIAHQVTTFRSGLYRIDPVVEPPPILFNSGWSDDLFPVNQPVHWIHNAKALHPGMRAALVASDYGHARASGADTTYAKSTIRAWFDHYLRGHGETPGPDVRARTQSCAGAVPAVLHAADTWHGLTPGEVRFTSAAGGTVLSSGGPSSASADTFDPIAGGNPCARVADEMVAGTVVLDFPSPDAGGYTLLGAATIVADMTVLGALPKDAELAARLLDVDASGDEQLLARAAYRPEGSGQQVFQLSAIGHHVPADHHVQIEFLGNEAPTFRQSNVSFTIDLANVEVRLPVVETPDGSQIQTPADFVMPAGYLPEPGLGASLVMGLLGVLGLARRGRRARSTA